MAIIQFKAAEVAQAIAHAETAETNHIAYTNAITKPGLWLVGDEGVYLTSNGSFSEHLKDPIAYAVGINPMVDDSDTWADAKDRVFGGDDGVVDVPGIDELKERIASGVEFICLDMNEDKVRLI
jgi:hypothetical protein